MAGALCRLHIPTSWTMCISIRKARGDSAAATPLIPVLILLLFSVSQSVILSHFLRNPGRSTLSCTSASLLTFPKPSQWRGGGWVPFCPIIVPLSCRHLPCIRKGTVWPSSWWHETHTHTHTPRPIAPPPLQPSHVTLPASTPGDGDGDPKLSAHSFTLT